jgi:hypothetical protein
LTLDASPLIHSLSGLHSTTSIIEHKSGSDPSKPAANEDVPRNEKEQISKINNLSVFIVILSLII